MFNCIIYKNKLFGRYICSDKPIFVNVKPAFKNAPIIDSELDVSVTPLVVSLSVSTVVLSLYNVPASHTAKLFLYMVSA